MLFQPSVGSNTPPYLPTLNLEARERIVLGISSLVSQSRESELERVARTKKRRIFIFLIDL